MPIDAGISVDGLAQFRRQLNKMDKQWGRELAKMNKRIAQQLAPKAQADARGLGGIHRHFAGDIKGVGSQTGARLSIAPRANAAFWGAKKNLGWFGGWTKPRNAQGPGYLNKSLGRAFAASGSKNSPPWVGNSGWQVGGAGGPYALNSAVRDSKQEIEEMYLEAIGQITREAFPEGGPL